MAGMSPQERVECYIVDWHLAWTAALANMGDTFDRDHWNELVGCVDRAHFVPGYHSDDDYSFSFSHSLHDPDAEEVVDVRPGAPLDGAGDLVTVETAQPDLVYGTLYMLYVLEPTRDGDHLIQRAIRLTSPPGAPLIDRSGPAAPTDLVASPESAFEELPAGVVANGDRLFENGRQHQIGAASRDDLSDILLVEPVGSVTTGGSLAIHDVVWLEYGLEPLAQRIPPGTYPIEVSRIHGRNAALRVIIERRPVRRWVAASTPSGRHRSGSDAGNLAVVDVAAVLDAEARTYQLRVDDLTRQGLSGEAATTFSLSAGPSAAADGVVAASGWGDGSYPAYWGLDHEQRPVVLVVDFLILASFADSGSGYSN